MDNPTPDISCANKLECIYCNTILRSKSALTKHQQTAKYCLKIQGVSCDKLKCIYCEYTTTTNFNLKAHYISCKVKKEQDRDKEIQALADKKLLEEIKEINTKLIGEVSKPKVINNTQNNLTIDNKMLYMKDMLRPLHETMPNIKTVIEENFTDQHLLGGVGACAKLIHDKILTSVSGEPYYLAIKGDKEFYYKDDKDNIKIDEGSIIETHIVPPLTKTSESTYLEKKRELSKSKPASLTPYRTAFNNIKKLKTDAEPLLTKLAKVSRVSSAKMKLHLKSSDDEKKESKPKCRPVSEKVKQQMIDRLKNYTEEEIKELLINFGSYCKFLLNYFDYTYDSLEQRYIYYAINDDNKTKKEQEECPNLLLFIFHWFKSTNIFKGSITSIFRKDQKYNKLWWIIEEFSPDDEKLLRDLIQA